ncbi:MAG: hypothetical protein WCK31_01770, partial [bacterium]
KNTLRYVDGKVRVVWNATKIPDVYINEQRLDGGLVYNENSDLKDMWKILDGKNVTISGNFENNDFLVKSINY